MPFKEIERKFLVEKPNFEYIGVSDVVHAEQYYIADSETTEIRVRKTWSDYSEGGEWLIYTLDVKSKPNGTPERDEVTIDISKRQFDALKLTILPDRAPIIKTRYEIDYLENNGDRIHILEFDVFDFDKDFCIMEIEMSSVDDEVVVPPFVKVIKEVTDDEDYYNGNIAKRVKKELVEQ